MKTADVKNIISNLTNELKVRWDLYRHAAFMKESGWTEEQYRDFADPDRNTRATRIKDYYHGYPYIVAFESSQGDPWTRFGTWIDSYHAIEEWCKENCKDKWRTDIHRVIKDYWGNWELNDIGGSDALFFVFKDVNDAFMFKLKWGVG
jgi:hypothetical protein